MSDWNFGGAYADTAGELQRQDQARALFPLIAAGKQADIEGQRANTRLHTAQAEIAESKIASEKRLMQIMQGVQLADGPDQSTNILKMAGAAMQAGDSTTAKDLILRASQVRTAESREAAALATQKKAQTEVRIKMADRYVQLLSGVNSAEDFARANMLFQSEFGEAAPNIAYDPNNIRLLRESVIKYRDRIYADHTTAMEGIAQQRVDNTASYRSELMEFRRKQEERRKASDDAKAKNGGKDVGAPAKSEIDAAKALLEREGKSKGLDVPTARTASFDLASRARALRRQNPGLDAGEAMIRALNDQVAEGYYSTAEATSGLGKLLGRKKQTYGKPGGTAEKALPVPADRKGLKAGAFYQTPKGNLQYLGGGKWKAPDASAVGAPPPDNEDEDDEDE